MASTPSPDLGGGRLHPAGHGPQGVDVQAGVDLVEDGEPGPQHSQLDRLVALALAAGEVDVERAGQEPGVEADPGRFGADQRRHLSRVATAGPQGLRQDVGQRHARHLDRVLHAEEQTGLGPLPGRQRQQVHAVEGHPARR